jgi:hypothetical protein
MGYILDSKLGGNVTQYTELETYRELQQEYYINTFTQDLSLESDSET